MIDKYKINKIVEYIKLSDFEFETDEVIENLDKVLAHYNTVGIDLTDDEYYFLIEELFPLAEQFEFRESAYLASQDEFLIA